MHSVLHLLIKVCLLSPDSAKKRLADRSWLTCWFCSCVHALPLSLVQMQRADQLRPVFNLVNEMISTCVVELKLLPQGGQLLAEFQNFKQDIREDFF